MSPLRRDEAGADWDAVRAALDARRKELRLSVAELRRRSGLSETTIRYLGKDPCKASTLTALSAGLGWPRNYLLNILRREPEKNVRVDTTASRLARIETKLDMLLAQGDQPEP